MKEQQEKIHRRKEDKMNKRYNPELEQVKDISVSDEKTIKVCHAYN